MASHIQRIKILRRTTLPTFPIFADTGSLQRATCKGRTWGRSLSASTDLQGYARTVNIINTTISVSSSKCSFPFN